MSSTSIDRALAARRGLVWPVLPALSSRVAQVGFASTTVSTFVRRATIIPTGTS